MSNLTGRNPDRRAVRVDEGRINAYDSESDRYVINLNQYGQANAVALVSGVAKAYSKGERVLCISLQPSLWSIVGRLQVSSPPQQTPQSTTPGSQADAILQIDQEVTDAQHKKYDLANASFRDPSQEPMEEGEFVISNDKDPRSYFKMYEGGDIYALATKFCYWLLDKEYNAFVLRVFDLLVNAAGLSLESVSDLQNKRSATKIKVDGDIQANTDEHTVVPDMDSMIGYINDPTKLKVAVSKQTSGQTLQNGVWSLFGQHLLLEVDNQRKEARLSKVAVDSSGADTSGKTRQFRMNEEECALEWAGGVVVAIDDKIEATKEKGTFSLNKTSASLDWNGHKVYIDDNTLALKWDANNYVALNANGVSVGGLLELVGGKIKISPARAAQDVPTGPQDNNYTIQMTLSGSVLNLALYDSYSLNISNDLTVRNQALVDERFFSLKYDNDMSAIRTHTHPVTTQGAIQSPQTVNIDLPPSMADSSKITSVATI